MPHTEFDRASGLHAAHFAALVEREGPRLRGGGRGTDGKKQFLALRSLQADRANIGLSLDFNLAQRDTVLLEATARYLWLYFDMTAQYVPLAEAYRGLQTVAADAGAPALAMLALLGQARADFRIASVEQAEEHCRSSLRLAEDLNDAQGQIEAEMTLALLQRIGGDYPAARKTLERVLQGLGEPPDPYWESVVVANLMLIEIDQGHVAVACDLANRAIQLKQEIGDQFGLAYVLNCAGMASSLAGDVAAERQRYLEAQQLFQLFGDERGEANVLNNLGTLDMEAGDLASARDYMERCLTLRMREGDLTTAAYAWANLSGIEYLDGDYRAAAGRNLEALRMRLQTGDQPRLVVSVIWTAAILARLGELDRAAVFLRGGQLHAAELDYSFDGMALQGEREAARLVGEGVAEGKLAEDQRASFQSQAEALTLDELAGLCIQALERYS